MARFAYPSEHELQERGSVVSPSDTEVDLQVHAGPEDEVDGDRIDPRSTENTR